MRNRDLERFKKILLKERERVSKEFTTLETANSSRESKDCSGYGIHMAEISNEEEEFEKNLMFLSNEGDILSLIGEAIEKIDNGRFGVCEGCGGPIPKARLVAKPFAKYCISCRMTEERNGNGKW